MTIEEVLKNNIELLKINNITQPISKARTILAFIINEQKQYLITNKDKELSKKQVNIYNKNINKLIKGEPLQYIIKNQEFMKLNFLVNKDVLIPQPDTEILVEEVLNIISKKENLKILDLCTGSGAIAISIAKYTKNCEIFATDISSKALKVAKINAKRNNVAEKIKFIKSNMFKNIKNIKFDIIVSNPPYIKKCIMKDLSIEVLKEPKIALNGGKDGMKFYRQIISSINKYLKSNGTLALEIGYDQKEKIENILNINNNNNFYCKKDLAGLDRVIIVEN